MTYMIKDKEFLKKDCIVESRALTELSCLVR